jgi:hypothetical protein
MEMKSKLNPMASISSFGGENSTAEFVQNFKP